MSKEITHDEYLKYLKKVAIENVDVAREVAKECDITLAEALTAVNAALTDKICHHIMTGVQALLDNSRSAVASEQTNEDTPKN